MTNLTTEIREYMASLGRKGGAARSPAKRKAAAQAVKTRWARERARRHEVDQQQNKPESTA